MSQRVRAAKSQILKVEAPEASLKSPTRMKIASKLASCGRNASLHFDSDAWCAMIAEQRQLIANAAGVDPSKVKIQMGH